MLTPDHLEAGRYLCSARGRRGITSCGSKAELRRGHERLAGLSAGDAAALHDNAPVK